MVSKIQTAGASPGLRNEEQNLSFEQGKNVPIASVSLSLLPGLPPTASSCRT